MLRCSSPNRVAKLRLFPQTVKPSRFRGLYGAAKAAPHKPHYQFHPTAVCRFLPAELEPEFYRYAVAGITRRKWRDRARTQDRPQRRVVHRTVATRRGHLDVCDGAVAQDLECIHRTRRPADGRVHRGLQPVAADAIAHSVHVGGKSTGEITAAGAAESHSALRRATNGELRVRKCGRPTLAIRHRV